MDKSDLLDRIRHVTALRRQLYETDLRLQQDRGKIAPARLEAIHHKSMLSNLLYNVISPLTTEIEMLKTTIENLKQQVTKEQESVTEKIELYNRSCVTGLAHDEMIAVPSYWVSEPINALEFQDREMDRDKLDDLIIINF